MYICIEKEEDLLFVISLFYVCVCVHIRIYVCMYVCVCVCVVASMCECEIPVNRAGVVLWPFLNGERF